MCVVSTYCLASPSRHHPSPPMSPLPPCTHHSGDFHSWSPLEKASSVNLIIQSSNLYPPPDHPHLIRRLQGEKHWGRDAGRWVMLRLWVCIWQHTWWRLPPFDNTSTSVSGINKRRHVFGWSGLKGADAQQTLSAVHAHARNQGRWSFFFFSFRVFCIFPGVGLRVRDEQRWRDKSASAHTLVLCG